MIMILSHKDQPSSYYFLYNNNPMLFCKVHFAFQGALASRKVLITAMVLISVGFPNSGIKKYLNVHDLLFISIITPSVFMGIYLLTNKMMQRDCINCSLHLQKSRYPSNMQPVPEPLFHFITLKWKQCSGRWSKCGSSRKKSTQSICKGYRGFD